MVNWSLVTTCAFSFVLKTKSTPKTTAAKQHVILHSNKDRSPEVGHVLRFKMRERSMRLKTFSLKRGAAGRATQNSQTSKSLKRASSLANCFFGTATGVDVQGDRWQHIE